MDRGTTLSQYQEKNHFIQNFLQIVRGSKSKNDFFKNIHEFDQKFTETSANMMNKHSLQSFPSAEQINYQNDRYNNNMHNPQNVYNSQNMQNVNNVNNKPKNPFLKDLNMNEEKALGMNYTGHNRINNFVNQQSHQYNDDNPNHNSMRINYNHKTQSFNPNNNDFPANYNNFTPNNYNLNPKNNMMDYQKSQIQSKKYQQGQKPYEKYNNEFNPLHLSKFNNNKQWNQELTSPANYNMKLDQLARNFQHMNLKDQHIQYNSNNKFNQISSFNNHVNNHQDQPQNQFLANLQQDTEPDFVKYYKKLTPSNHSNNSLHQETKPIFVGDHRSNPFAVKN